MLITYKKRHAMLYVNTKRDKNKEKEDERKENDVDM